MKTASCPIFGPRSTSPTRIHPGGNCFSRKPDLYRLYRLYNAYAGKEYVWGKGLEDLDNLYNPYKAVRPAKLALCHVFEEGSDKPSGGAVSDGGRAPVRSTAGKDLEKATGGNPGFPHGPPFPGGLPHGPQTRTRRGFPGVKKESGPALKLPDRFSRFDVFEGHGARVALQRCPILRDVLTIAKSPPFLQPKTDKKLTKLNL
jgi:hypothetical protein